MLMLYRKLCRHLYGLDQDSAVFYVNHYREMFDEDSSQKFEPIISLPIRSCISLNALCGYDW
ncbi:MAG: hypothetical protein RL711_1607 [Bacteroidota bacterium]|jgi:hypothetical protein